MGLLSLKVASLMDWAAADLILTSLFAAIITVNLLLLRRRVQHLEWRNIFDLEDGRHDVELLKKFRDLQTTESKKGPLDEKAYRCFKDIAGGKLPCDDLKCKDQEMALRYEQLFVAIVKFFQLEQSEASDNEKQELGAVVASPDYTAAVVDETQSKEAGHITDSNDHWYTLSHSPSKPLFTVMKEGDQLSQINSWSLHKCSGCSKQMARDKFRKICELWGCGCQWCDSCMDNIQKSTSHLGRLTQAYCTSCGTVLASHGFDLLSPREAVYLERTLRNFEYTSVQMASCVVAEIGGGTIDLVACDIDLASGEAHLSPIHTSKTSSRVIMDDEELSAIPNFNTMTSAEESSQPSSKKLFNVPIVPACWSEHQQSPYDAFTMDPALISGAWHALPVKSPSISHCPPLRSSSLLPRSSPAPTNPATDLYLPDCSLPGSRPNVDKFKSIKEILEAEDGIENPLSRLPPQDDGWRSCPR